MSPEALETAAASPVSGWGQRTLGAGESEGSRDLLETLDVDAGPIVTIEPSSPVREADDPCPPILFDGAYELVELMGEGAMGAVWRARNVNLDKQVAVKLVKLASSDPSAHTRLRNEARLAAKITHVNVVGVFDTGVTDDGSYYLVMELLDGNDLGHLLEGRGSVPAVEAVQIILPILAGLECAHKRKVLHRDIKPENIFMARTEDGVVPKLVDFGIALAGDVPQDMRTTRIGSLLGTPLYMAPEQARGSLDLDERTDLWAVATVLYELIAGQAPFAGDSLQALFFAIACHPAPPIDEAVCDAELAAILSRGLAKDADHRWSTAREMGVALAHWLASYGVHHDISGEPVEKVWLRAGSIPAPPSSSRSPLDSHTVIPPLATSVAQSRPGRWFRRVPGRWALAAAALLGFAYYSFGTMPSQAVASKSEDLGASEETVAVVVSVVPTSTPPPSASGANATSPKPPSTPRRELVAPEPKKTDKRTATTEPVGATAPAQSSHSRVDPNWGF